MPNEQQLDEIINLSLLESLPELVWQQIMRYLDQKSKQQLRLSSKTNRKHIDDHSWCVDFKKQTQFSKFIENPPSYPYINTIQLSSDVTSFLFPYPYNPHTSNFSFFSEIRTHFPRIENIYLEFRHLYMLWTLTIDPLINNNYKLIKKLTIIPMGMNISLVTKKSLKKIKYKHDDGILSNLSAKELESYYSNFYLTRKTLNLFKKFTSLEYLGVSLYDGLSCDYEDLAYLLQTLPLLKTLELNLPFDLIYEPEPNESLLEFKSYTVTESALKSYPHIRTLILKGRYWSPLLLSHFPELSHLTLDYSYYDTLKQKNIMPNKINQLLAPLHYPEKLISLEIPASVPIKIDQNKYTFKLVPTRLKQLTQFTQLQKLTINPPKNFYTLYLDGPQKKFYYIKQSPLLFFSKNFILHSIKELEIRYNPLNCYQQGDFSAIRTIFPNLTCLRITREKTHWSFFNQIKELCTLLHENPWQDIQINIHGMNLSQDRASLQCLSLFPNTEFTEDRWAIQSNARKTDHTGEASKKIKLDSKKSFVSQFFHSHDSGIEDLEEKKSLKRQLL